MRNDEGINSVTALEGPWGERSQNLAVVEGYNLKS